MGTAAMLHVAAAFPEVDTDSFPADTIGPFYHDGEIITKPLDLGPPHAKVPDGPGLGVELDEAAVKHGVVSSGVCITGAGTATTPCATTSATDESTQARRRKCPCFL